MDYALAVRCRRSIYKAKAQTMTNVVSGTTNAMLIVSASATNPSANGPMAPPTTLIINIDDAFSVFAPRPRIDSAKMVGNIRLSKRKVSTKATFDTMPSGEITARSIITVPQAHTKNTFSVATRVMMKLLRNRPSINSINPPNDNAQVA